ncbi:hypothetical protein SprV_0301055900 [Sparganum proliferum]
MQAGPGDDEAVIRPAVGVGDSLGRQHVLSISLPDEGVVQQLSAMRSEMHAGGLLAHRNVHDVGGAEEEEEVRRRRSRQLRCELALPSRPRSLSDPGIEVTRNNQLIHLRHSVQVLVEFVLCFPGFCPWSDVGADAGGEFDSRKRQP